MCGLRRRWLLGHPITVGTRMILVLFMYVDGFNYGELLGWDKVGNHGNHPAAAETPGCTDGEAEGGHHDGGGGGGAGCGGGGGTELVATVDPGGFVVYNETHELMSMLDNEGDGDGDGGGAA